MTNKHNDNQAPLLMLRTCFKKQEIVPKRSGFGNPLQAALGGSR